MTGPQPGPYPQYPGGGGMPAEQPKPPPPDTVQNAFYLMLAGAGLQALGIISALAQIGAIRDTIRERVEEQSDGSTLDVDRLVNISIVSIIVVGLLGVALWLWMAYANRAGKNWARITATVFFGISTMSLLSNLAVQSTDSTVAVGSSGTAFGMVLNVLMWLVGLAAIILLWHRRSGPYFKRPTYGYEYQPPGAASGYPPTGPGPAPGQTAPPPGGEVTPPAPPPGPPDSQPGSEPGSRPGPPQDGPQDMPPPR
ncbi:MAG TPA: hypothetical protein VFU43_15830 [Streptosporangiaceae bacterium]|nr:hypothetical protein [Streptosporangiaceae bacterium]